MSSINFVGADDETADSGEHEVVSTGSVSVHVPDGAYGLVHSTFFVGFAYGDQDELVFQLEFWSVVLSDYLVGVSHAAFVGSGAAHAVGETRVCVNQGRFDFSCGVWFHAVAVDDVLHIETFCPDLVDATELGVHFVLPGALDGPCHMLEYAVATAASYVKCFAVPWVDQSVHVMQQGVPCVGGEALGGHGCISAWGDFAWWFGIVSGYNTAPRLLSRFAFSVSMWREVGLEHL